MSTALPEEWRLEADGRFCRDAVRVLLLDTDDRLLLVHGHAQANPGEHWWFTVGGGVDPGEDPRAAGVRETAEEAGLSLRPEELVGPVLRRTVEFEFFDQPVRQHELFFLARIDSAAPRPSDAGWTELERQFVDELRWWSLEELAASSDTVFPPDLAALTARLTTGWDGITRDDGIVDE